jgi:hypothetical protein
MSERELFLKFLFRIINGGGIRNPETGNIRAFRIWNTFAHQQIFLTIQFY